MTLQTTLVVIAFLAFCFAVGSLAFKAANALAGDSAADAWPSIRPMLLVSAFVPAVYYHRDMAKKVWEVYKNYFPLLLVLLCISCKECVNKQNFSLCGHRTS